MLEGAKSIGAGAATIALAGAAIGIGNVFSSLIHSVVYFHRMIYTVGVLLQRWLFLFLLAYLILSSAPLPIEKQILVIYAATRLNNLFSRAWVSLALALAGLRGRTAFRLPGGISVDSSWIKKIIFVLLLGLFCRESFLYMNELLQAAAQFCPTAGGGMSGTGGGGGLPEPGGFPAPVLYQDDERGGSPIWGTLSPVQRLPSLEPAPQGSQESWLSRLMELSTPASSEEVGGPSPISTPANVGCSTSGNGAQNPVSAGPSNPNAFPYDENYTIGGDSVASIRHRILSQEGDTPLEEVNYLAEDLFEVKAKLILLMAQHDVDGDWLNRGARALDYPKSRSGEYSLEQLYEFHTDLSSRGLRSKTFYILKDKVLRKRP